MSYKGPERRKHRDRFFLSPKAERNLLILAGILFAACVGAGLHAVNLLRGWP